MDRAVTGPGGDVLRWFRERCRGSYTKVRRVPLDALDGWRVDRETGDIVHHTGRFFTIHGLEVRFPSGPVPTWSQPIITQPEVGILGLLAKEIDGVRHFLVQAKVEPGNRDGLQISPTVQATRSNYTGVHGGKSVPYLEYFRDHGRHRVLADVRHSEQGAWFYQKRNRNMIVELDEDVPVRDGFRWLTLDRVHELLAVEDLVNMDLRTVLSCLPAPDTGLARHEMTDLLSWLTDVRTGADITTRRVPLRGLPGWNSSGGRIRHESGTFFSVIGVEVEAGGREVRGWAQPMIEPAGEGVIAFLVTMIDGEWHALMNASVEPGYADVAELAPTVQCIPGSYRALPCSARPPFLDQVLDAPARDVLYDTVLSEEGGRFYHARNRYMIVETEAGDEPPDYRWVALHQLTGLLRHSHYLNVQARSLVACLRSLPARDAAASATRRGTLDPGVIA
ncbi:NDP-hexose 2,3-dehydratase family protein [Spirillospora sp. NBC_00431]